MRIDKDMLDKDFHRYLDGEMTPHERQFFERGLSGSPEKEKLLRFFETLRSEVREDLKKEMSHPPTTYLWEAVRDKLEGASQKSWSFRPHFLRAGLGLAIACAIMIVSYRFLSQTMFVSPNNECMVEYIDNRTNTVTIFRGTKDGLTYIWITENPDQGPEEKHSLKQSLEEWV